MKVFPLVWFGLLCVVGFCRVLGFSSVYILCTEDDVGIFDNKRKMKIRPLVATSFMVNCPCDKKFVFVINVLVNTGQNLIIAIICHIIKLQTTAQLEIVYFILLVEKLQVT